MERGGRPSWVWGRHVTEDGVGSWKKRRKREGRGQDMESREAKTRPKPRLDDDDAIMRETITRRGIHFNAKLNNT